MSAKHFLLLTCGGTIAMESHGESNKLSSCGQTAMDHYIQEVGTIFQERLRLKQKPLFNIDSTDMSPEHWLALLKEIRQGLQKGVDGVLITTGTNTLGYASSALSFALGELPIPVVLTGAQIPATEIASDARNNFINALRVMLDHPLTGVFVVFGSRVIRGCRAKKRSEFTLDAFASYKSNDLGNIGIRLDITPQPLVHPAPRPVGKDPDRFEERVVSLTLTPGLRWQTLKALIDGGTKGLVLRAYGSGDIPEQLLKGLEYARQQEVPVVVTTQCPEGVTMIGLNPPGKKALEYGIIPSFDMSMEAMTTKLMWLLGQGVPYGSIRQEMLSNYVGEISPSPQGDGIPMGEP